MRKVSLILAITLLLFQTGCWNAREINELAFVMSLALDKAEEGYHVTAQIAKPDVYSKSATGGAGITQKEKPFWVFSGNGKTIFEAIRNMAEISPRRIFWSHIKVIIISDEVARSNVLDIFDFFSRNPELRLRTWVAITQGNAGKILEIVPMIEKDPSQNIEQIINKTSLSGKAYSIMLKDFLEDYLDPYTDPVASRIVVTTVNSRPTIKLEGAAVFKTDRFVDWLDADETRGLLWIKNKASESIKVVDCPYDGQPVTIEIKKGKTKIKSQIIDGVPSFTISATAVGKLTEKACRTDFNNKETIKALEAALASAIHDDIELAVIAAQKYDADFLNFSRTLQSDHKKDWNQISSNWDKLFKTAKVDIQVKVDIPEISLLAKSLVPK
jgi:spore germination protein KC